MTERIRVLLAAHIEQIAYLAVGCMTTLINYTAYALLTAGAAFHYIAGNIIAWVAAVTFAYFANGKWVYRSASRRSFREAASFVLSRLVSLGLETIFLFLLVSLLGAGEMTSKLLVAVLVVIINYLTGLWVFKHEKGA